MLEIHAIGLADALGARAFARATPEGIWPALYRRSDVDSSIMAALSRQAYDKAMPRLSERDVCTKFITPALVSAGWDLHSQIREEVSFTKGRVIVRGNGWV